MVVQLRLRAFSTAATQNLLEAGRCSCDMPEIAEILALPMVLARDRMFQLRSFEAATSGFTCAFFFGGMSTRGERPSVWLSRLNAVIGDSGSPTIH